MRNVLFTMVAIYLGHYPVRWSRLSLLGRGETRASGSSRHSAEDAQWESSLREGRATL